MAQNVTVAGASYSDVPSVLLPKTGGGTATFTDVSDTTAAAADVASGKYFYTAAGVKTAGTASGGGGTGTVVIEDTTDSAGGTIRTITAVDISDTTAAAADVAQGKYFYTAGGVKTQGTASGGGSGAQYKSGTYTPSQDYTTTGNRLITTLANIGFSPKKFIFRVTDRASVANTKSAALYSLADNDAAVRWSCRYSDTSNSVGQNRAFSDWTTQQEMFLYCDGTSVYFRTYNNQYFLFSGVSYTWEAFG